MYETVEVSGEVIKSPIAIKIRDTFKVAGNPITYPTVYKEKTNQALIKPSFFINTVNVSQDLIKDDTYERTYMMEVRYLPEDNLGDEYEHLCSVGNKLLLSLNRIDVNIFLGDFVDDVPVFGTKPIFGEDLTFKIDNGVLQLFCNYSIRLKILEDDGVLMETLEVKTN